MPTVTVPEAIGAILADEQVVPELALELDRLVAAGLLGRDALEQTLGGGETVRAEEVVLAAPTGVASGRSSTPPRSPPTAARSGRWW